MSIAPLRHTPIRRKLLTLALAAGLAFVTVSALFALSWRDLEKDSARVSSTYIPTLRDGAAALVSVSALGTELFRYVNQIQPSAYRVVDALEGARAALQRIARSDIPPEIRANIESLLPQVAAQEAGLRRLTARVERDDVLGIGEEHTRMAAEAGVMLRGVERIHDQLLDSIVRENRIGRETSLQRAAVAAALSVLCILAALFYMGMVRRDLESGIAQLGEAARRYANAESVSIAPLDRRDEVGQLSRYLNQLSAQIKEIEAQLRERLKFINDVFDSVPLSLAFRDMEGRFRLVNRTWEQYFGFSREETFGKTPADLAAMPGGADSSEVVRIAAEDRRALDLGPGKSTEPREVVLRGRHRLHSRHYLQSRTAMGDAQGNLTGVLIAGLDQTERVEMERELATQQQRLELVVRAAKAGIIDTDAVSKTAWYSDRLKELLGYPADTDTSSWTFFDKMHPEDRPRILDAFVAHLKGKDPAVRDSLMLEYRLLRLDGSIVWVQGMGLSLRDATGRSTRFLASITDVSERRQQEEALRTQEQRLELVVRASKVGIIDWDGATHTAWYSARLKEMLGYAADADMSKWVFFESVHPEDAERVRRMLIETLKGETGTDAFLNEFRMRRAGGGYVWMQVTGLALRGADGRAARFLSSVRDVSERRAQDEALRTQERRLDMAVRAGKVGIVDWDNTTGRVWFSDLYKEMLGYPPDTDTSEWSFFDDVHPEEREDLKKLLMATLKGETGSDTMEREARMRRRDGSYIWAHGMGLALRGPDGRTVRYIMTARETTARRAQEQALRDQMQLTRDLIDRNPNPVFLKDEERRFVEINRAYSNLTRITPEQAIGRTVFDLYPEKDALVYDQQDRELLARGEGENSVEVDVVLGDGKRHYFLMNKSVLRRADGTVRGMVCTLTEITQIKEIEATLRDSEERMRFWLENIPIPIAIYDPQGGVQFLNSAFVATFGWGLEEMRGKRMPFVPEHRREQLAGVLHKLLTVGKDAFETERMTKDGRLLDIYISTGMARAPDGTPRATMVSLMDVSERKRMERELSASRDAALQAEQAKSAFLAAMSHEIRTPLNGVLGMAGLLEGTALSSEQREYVETIQVSGDALLAVINDILDYSKIESGRMELEQAPLEPVRAIEESLEILGARARAKGLELIAETDDNLPAWVLGDLARLRQVLMNLVGNAVKFTDAGEILVSARAPEPGQIEFAVSDTGIGIPQDRIGALFDAFSQVDVSTTRKYGGTGLGLAISRRLVEFMGGELRVESEPGRGSTFSFRVRAQPCEPSTVPKSAFAAADVLRGRRLLVVDDNETNRRILAHQLERWGAAQVAEASAAAALERLAADRAFDAALLDYHMPGMDGVMLARELRRRGLKLPLVLLSSSMYRRAEEAETELFAAQLLKPIRQQQLQAAIAAAIAGEHFEPGPARRAPPGEARLAERLPLRILVADDVEVNRRLAVALLRNFGYAADAVESGREAVAAADRYDLVLMDVQMPDLDGLEATRQIRSRTAQQRDRRGPRIIALTASAMAGDRERCLAAGMDDYLAKPLQPQALRAALEQVGRGAARQAGRRRVARPARAIDWSRIESLRPFDPDGSMVAGAIAAFLADAPARIHAIRAAHAVGDAAGLASAAHALKGAAANVGAARLQELSHSIEALARDGRSQDAARAIGGLAKSLAAARAALAKGKASPGS